MLILTRRSGQKIVIGNEVVIEVVSISGEGVKIGISAPSNTSVHRFEIYEEIQLANRGAEIDPDFEGTALKTLAEVVRTRQEQ